MNSEITEMKRDKKHWFAQNWLITLIISVSAFLNVWNIWNLGFANKYYAAGVYSMGQNLHAFFFNSLDSIGFVTIDKPPLGFWIQVIFTKIFGFNGAVLILPQAIASVISVYLIYRIISKRFSKSAGLISAGILALTPIFVAVSRNNTIDGLLILLLVLASQQAIIAAEKASMKHLIFAGVFIGLGFNVKMLQAFVIVPAIYLTYLVFAKQKFFKKILVCTVSFIVLLVISLSWVTAVDLVPEENRPYIGSSENNSALNLALGYNGLNRIFGRNSVFRSDSSQPSPQNAMSNDALGTAAAPINNQNKPNMPSNTNGQRPNAMLNQQINNANRSAGGESGEAGITRLYNIKNAGQISWFVLPSVLTCVLMLWLIFSDRFKRNSENIALLYFALCFIPIFIYFSFSSGLAHRYYFATIAPFMAGLLGIGFYHLTDGKKFWTLIVFAPTAIAQLYIQTLYKGWYDWLIPMMSAVFVFAAIVMAAAAAQKAKKGVFTALLCTLLILPGVWSATPMIYNDNSQLPIAGPELTQNNDSFDNERDLSGLIEYLEENREGADYLTMAPSSMTLGAELILQSGEAVMVLGGFNGGDQVVTVDEFIEMVKDGKVRYAVYSGDNSKNTKIENAIYQWINRNGKIVRPMEYGGNLRNVTVFKLS